MILSRLHQNKVFSGVLELKRRQLFQGLLSCDCCQTTFRAYWLLFAIQIWLYNVGYTNVPSCIVSIVFNVRVVIFVKHIN